ncbi:hypothetical protein ACHAWF_013399 [Thalassiosira exigua]
MPTNAPTSAPDPAEAADRAGESAASAGGGHPDGARAGGGRTHPAGGPAGGPGGVAWLPPAGGVHGRCAPRGTTDGRSDGRAVDVAANSQSSRSPAPSPEPAGPSPGGAVGSPGRCADVGTSPAGEAEGDAAELAPPDQCGASMCASFHGAFVGRGVGSLAGGLFSGRSWGESKCEPPPDQGRAVGSGVGLSVGPDVGLDMGLAVGPAVRLATGPEVGLALGPGVGASDGPPLGRIDGSSAGGPLGTTLGMCSPKLQSIVRSSSPNGKHAVRPVSGLIELPSAPPPSPSPPSPSSPPTLLNRYPAGGWAITKYLPPATSIPFDAVLAYATEAGLEPSSQENSHTFTSPTPCKFGRYGESRRPSSSSSRKAWPPITPPPPPPPSAPPARPAPPSSPPIARERERRDPPLPSPASAAAATEERGRRRRRLARLIVAAARHGAGARGGLSPSDPTFARGGRPAESRAGERLATRDSALAAPPRRRRMPRRPRPLDRVRPPLLRGPSALLFLASSALFGLGARAAASTTTFPMRPDVLLMLSACPSSAIWQVDAFQQNGRRNNCNRCRLRNHEQLFLSNKNEDESNNLWSGIVSLWDEVIEMSTYGPSERKMLKAKRERKKKRQTLEQAEDDEAVKNGSTDRFELAEDDDKEWLEAFALAKNKGPGSEADATDRLEYDGYALRDLLLDKWGVPLDVDFRRIGSSIYCVVLPAVGYGGGLQSRHDAELDYLMHLQGIVEVLYKYDNLFEFVAFVEATDKVPKRGTDSVPFRLNLSRRDVDMITSR